MLPSSSNIIPPELADLKVYFGDASPAEARVYAQLPAGADRSNCHLTGKISGPFCVYAHTLAPMISLRSLGARSVEGANDSLLAEAILPDPCFWSAELPFLYRVQVELRNRDYTVATAEVSLGISALGARGRDLVWQGKRWVLRGARCVHVSNSPLEHWREADMTLDVQEPTDDLCAQASRTGVGAVARISGSPARIESRLHELGRYPAVILAILQSDGPLDANIHQIAPNLLLGELFEAGQELTPSTWAKVAICADEVLADLAERASKCPIPVIADHSAGGLMNLAEGRAACDRLQADLASVAGAKTSFAGYIV